MCRAADAGQQAPPAAGQPPQLKAFLDCQDCFSDFLRTEVTFVDYVRDRTEADVHVLITAAETGSGGVEYTIAFIGLKAFSGTDRTLKTVTVRADPEDVVRRQLANSLRVGLLNYVVGNGVPPKLAVSVRLDPPRWSRGPGDRPVEPLGVQRARVRVVRREKNPAGRGNWAAA